MLRPGYLITFCLGVLLVMLALPAMDSDFQLYALLSKMIYAGKIPYVDYFDHKPPFFPIALLPGNLLGGSFIHFGATLAFYVGCLYLLLYRFSYFIFNKSCNLALLTVFVFSILTVGIFRDNGYINGAIILFNLFVNLIGLNIIATRIFDSSLDSKKEPLILISLGVIGAIAFLTRFSGTVCFATLFYIFHSTLKVENIKKLNDLKEKFFSLTMKIFLKGTIFLVGFFASSYAIIKLIKTPLGALRYALFDFNQGYNSISSSVLQRAANLGLDIYKLTEIDFLTKLNDHILYINRVLPSYILYGVALAVYIFFRKNKPYKLPGTKYYLIGTILLSECLYLLTHKPGQNFYYFLLYFVISIISVQCFKIIISYFENDLTNKYVNSNKTFAPILVIILLYTYNLFQVKESNINYFYTNWPEKELVTQVKNCALDKKCTPFVSDEKPYVYIEADVLPTRVWSVDYMKLRWSRYYKDGKQNRVDLKKFMDKLSRNPPKLIIGRSQRYEFKPLYKFIIDNNYLTSFQIETFYHKHTLMGYTKD